MLTWLDFFCRQGAELALSKGTARDPRQELALLVAQWFAAAKRGRLVDMSILEEVWYASLAPFVAPFLPVGASLNLVGGRPLAPPLGLVLTRATAGLLSDAALPPSADPQVFASLAEGQAIYVDVPHGAVTLELKPGDVVGVRAILAANYLPMPVGVTGPAIAFVALLAPPGSERGRGRLAGVLTADGNTLALASVRRPNDTQADFTLKAPFAGSSGETVARDRAGAFLRLVLAYHAFGPAEAREPIAATPRERLVQGKPRRDESLFAMTRLQPAHDRLGRPATGIPASWSLTSRQEVSGHFKLQPHGPAGSLRKLIWVEGYARGPEDAPRKPRAVRV